MNDPESGPSQPRPPVLFATEDTSPKPTSDRSESNWLPWIVALVIIGCGLGLAFWLARPPAAAPGAGVDPYAKFVVITGVHVSQASNFAGDQLTYVEGTIQNNGPRTVTSVTLQTFFANDSGEPAQMQQAPVSLIRSRDPYVDTEPISAAPLTPGKSQDFRMVFDSVPGMWNQQPPHLQIQHIDTRP